MYEEMDDSRELDRERQILSRFKEGRSWGYLELKEDVLKSCPHYEPSEVSVAIFQLIGKKILSMNDELKVKKMF